jgi:hypothetical protein
MRYNRVVLNVHEIDNNKVLLQNMLDDDQKNIPYEYDHNNIFFVFHFQVMYQDKVQVLVDVFHIDHHIH